MRQKFSLKAKVGELQAENAHLKHQIRSMDAEFKRKDQIVHRLADELKRTNYQQSSSPDQSQQQTWTIPGVYVQGTQQQSQSKPKASTQVAELKRVVKELRSDLAMKENELLNIQMTTKYLRLTELETQVVSLQNEVSNLNMQLQDQSKVPLHEHRKQIEAYEQQLQFSAQTCQQYEKQLADMQSTKDKLDKKLASQHASLMKVKAAKKLLKEQARQQALKLHIASRSKANLKLLSKYMSDQGHDVPQILAQHCEKLPQAQNGKSVVFTFCGP